MSNWSGVAESHGPHTGHDDPNPVKEAAERQSKLPQLPLKLGEEIDVETETATPEGEEGCREEESPTESRMEEPSHGTLEEEFPFHPDLFGPTKGKRNSVKF